MPNSPKKDLEKISGMVTDAENALASLFRKYPHARGESVKYLDGFIDNIKRGSEHIGTGTRFKAARGRYARSIRNELSYPSMELGSVEFFQEIDDIENSLDKVYDMLATLGDKAMEARELYDQRYRPQLEELLRSLEG